MIRVLLRAAAAADLDEAFGWYEDQRAGLGEDFRNAVDSTLAHVAENPEAYAVILRDTRRALVQRFPYGVFYRLVDGDVVVVACLHVKRHPRTWRSRT